MESCSTSYNPQQCISISSMFFSVASFPPDNPQKSAKHVKKAGVDGNKCEFDEAGLRCSVQGLGLKPKP